MIKITKQQLINYLDQAYKHGKNDMWVCNWVEERTKIINKINK